MNKAEIVFTVICAALVFGSLGAAVVLRYL